MRIQEIERLTGLTRKTIRYWEARGLVRVERSDNSYRAYDEEALRQLRLIAALRQAGISVTAIQLWQDGVISSAELLTGRLDELKTADSVTAGQRELCGRLLNHVGQGIDLREGLPDTSIQPQQDEGADFDSEAPLCVGIDIGTTTISAAILDLANRRQLTSCTLQSGADIPVAEPWRHEQDAGRIFGRVKSLLDSLLDRCPNIRAVGLSCQMHGIVCVDGDGRLLSPLYTWQDGRAGLQENGRSAVGELRALTEASVSAGYGLATCLYNKEHGLLPAGTAKICTIGDYVGMALTGRTSPLTHVSNAAPWAAGTWRADASPPDWRRPGWRVCCPASPTARCCWAAIGAYRRRQPSATTRPAFSAR